MKQNAIWVSAYIYSDPPHEELLVDGVLPLVKKGMNAGLANRYFFIRYFDRGHHIRLRFEVEKKNEETVRDMINERVGEYFVAHPKKREMEKDEYLPHQSIQYIPYEPEVDRYGGEQRIKIAEEQFMYSSEAVLSFLSVRDNWQYERRLGFALQLAVIQLYAFGYREDSIKAYVKRILSLQLKASKVITMSMLSSQLRKQPELKDVGRSIYHSVKLHVEKKDNGLEYVMYMRKICMQLVKCKTEDSLLESLLSSYIHMTNNRLGIKNTDEIYLYYLLCDK